ncbi:MAG: TIGR04255 family protein [Acidobacteria bacterium]|nr:TIGR04255 family protein [Acidobacteriota bacterium]
MSEHKYKYPTIIEAILELRVHPSSAWGISSFVEFARLAKDQGYPILKDVNPNYQFVIPVGTSGETPSITPLANRIQTWNDAGTQLWQAGPQLYAANRRYPYDGWENFCPHILEGFKLYNQIAKPVKAETLVLQYINRIELEEPNLDPRDFLTFVSPMIKYAEEIDNFICRTEQSYTDQERIVVTSARDLSSEKMAAVILDISYIILNPDLELPALEQLIRKAHDAVGNAFEKSITPKQQERMVPLC